MFVFAASTLTGAAVTLIAQRLLSSRCPKTSPAHAETDHAVGQDLVGVAIGGAMNGSQMYIGDHLGLYTALRDLCCAAPDASATALDLADHTGLSARWLREWLAHQAASGVLLLLPGEGDGDADLQYRLPRVTGEVLADPDSSHYAIPMIQAVPALVWRAKTMLPEAFRTGLGRGYDDEDVCEAIDRKSAVYAKHVFLPEIVEKAGVADALRAGVKVADLGCGAAVLMIAMARAFPRSEFHGYEISKVALLKGAERVVAAGVRNMFLHDATEEPLGECEGVYDLVTTFDVLHDATDPAGLIAQVRAALKEDGVWVLGDIPCEDGVRANEGRKEELGVSFAFSTTLCMSSSLSEKGGAGLGTLGLSIPVAKKMLGEGGFEEVDVFYQDAGVCWFLVK